MIFNTFNLHPAYRVSPARVEKIATYVFSHESCEVRSVNFIFSDDENLLQLKEQYFSRKAYTDTISFHFNEPGEAVEGEVYISLDRIAENASRFSVPFKNELARVIIHSILHLCGYEDKKPEDALLMHGTEDKYLEKIDYNYLVRRT